MSGILYVVGTPIGNLDDVSVRVLRVLREVDCVAAEDTRRTRKLFAHYDIHTRLVSCHQAAERRKAPALVAALERGERIALVTDAGTPTLSDPGCHLVRAAASAGVPVVPIPGPSAVTALLSVSGLPADSFVFEGFLPARPGRRRRRLDALRDQPRTLVLFEAPHRVLRTLGELIERLGDREAVVGRELTKQFEETLRGRLSEILATLQSRGQPRGEFTIVVRGAAA